VIKNEPTRTKNPPSKKPILCIFVSLGSTLVGSLLYNNIALHQTPSQSLLQERLPKCRQGSRSNCATAG
jgi:hypothetical protein